MTIPSAFPAGNPPAADHSHESTPTGRLTLFALFIDGQAVVVDGDTIHDPARLEELRRRCGDGGRIVAELSLLLEWPDEDRRKILRWLADLGREHGDVAYRVTHNGDTHADLLDAILSLFRADQSTSDRSSVLTFAVEAAAYAQPNGLEIACNSIVNRLREHGVRGLRVAALVAQARDLLRRPVAGRGDDNAVRVHEVLPDAPCPADTIVPPKWILTADGIVSRTAGPEVLVPAPVLATRRLTDVDGGDESVELAWWRGGAWHTRIVARGTIAKSRTIVELADYGLPVTSTNAEALVDYLLDIEVANFDVLPQSRVSHRMGWLRGNDEYQLFLCGRQLVSNESSEGQTERVEFRGFDVGDEQLVAGLHDKGDFDTWRNAITPLQQFPRARLGVIASLAPPLLAPLATHNFIISYAGATSTGKTSTLRLGASCWGCPDERSPAAAIGTWDATRVWLERASAINDCIPLIIDDTQRAKNRHDIGQTIYDVTNGRGRGRGSERGLARTNVWRTVMCTTGEGPLTTYTEHGGTRARALEMWGSPFGQLTAGSASLVSQLNEVIREHYGHAGPRFVRHLINSEDSWPVIQERFRQLREFFQQRAGTNSVAGRMAEHFAVLHVTEELACQAGILPWDNLQTANALWAEITAETDEADRAAVALRYVAGWCHAHESDLWTSSNRLYAPSTGWAGRWRVTGRQGEPECLALYPHRLDKVLEERGFEAAAVRRLWKDREWLRASDGKTTLKVRIDADTIEMVAIRWDAIRSVMGTEEAVA